MNVKNRTREASDVPVVAAAFEAAGWNKPVERSQRCLHEQEAGVRQTPVATVEGTFAGYLNAVWEPGHPPLRDTNTPEIQDFNARPPVIGTKVGLRAGRVRPELP